MAHGSLPATRCSPRPAARSSGSPTTATRRAIPSLPQNRDTDPARSTTWPGTCNLYPGTSPLALLSTAAGDDVSVLASTYRRALAPSRGILITSPGPDDKPRQVKALVEKPDPAQARALEDKHGAENLPTLEGRARLTAPFIQFARAR
jgi:hypothetical protein